jgi:hypothetical protein
MQCIMWDVKENKEKRAAKIANWKANARKIFTLHLIRNSIHMKAWTEQKKWYWISKSNENHQLQIMRLAFINAFIGKNHNRESVKILSSHAWVSSKNVQIAKMLSYLHSFDLTDPTNYSPIHTIRIFTVIITPNKETINKNNAY